MKPHKPKTLFYLVAVAFGLALAAFEVSRLVRGGAGESWFWLLVAAMMVLLGMSGLLLKPPK